MITRVSQSIYVYVATLVRLIDGDTGEFEIDEGFKRKWTTKVRFIGIDTYEIRGVQASPYGQVAKAFLADLFEKFGPRCYLHTDRDQIAVYNRVAGRPYLEDNSGDGRVYIDVVESLRASGFAKGSTPLETYEIVRIPARDIMDIVSNLVARGPYKP